MTSRIRITARQRQNLAAYHREHSGASAVFLAQAGGRVTIHGLVRGQWRLLQAIEGIGGSR